jgi:peptidoglycan/LPS O-acetylase OafA/YrhL
MHRSVSLRAFPGYPSDDGAPFWAGWFAYGRFAVLVFIVLSGFSPALAPARAGWRLDGIVACARRRARRILPAYWAALVFSLAVAWLIVPQPRSGAPDAMSVVVNGLLVQNVVGAPSPNTAFWSIVAIVYGLIVARWFQPGAAAFLVSLALVLPLTIVFAKAFASIFERSFRTRGPTRAGGQALRRGEVVLG